MRQSLFLKLRSSQAQQPNNLSMLSWCAPLSARRNARNDILKDDSVVRSHWKLTTAFGSQHAGRLAFRTVLQVMQRGYLHCLAVQRWARASQAWAGRRGWGASTAKRNKVFKSVSFRLAAAASAAWPRGGWVDDDSAGNT